MRSEPSHGAAKGGGRGEAFIVGWTIDDGLLVLMNKVQITNIPTFSLSRGKYI
jgi:hypothetical protein